ncbi:thymidine kinase [Crocinitomicaceae bacterium]|jgi:thymidine kinase|nr:thymidine kinase [Crocinitomicaceae bacterium]
MFLEQFPLQKKSNGWIEVICGSMFSGKTEELIRRLRRAEFANQQLILFKPKIDNRYSKNNVVSHSGNEFEAVLIENSSEIIGHINQHMVVAIDEAQFFDDGIVGVCESLSAKGIRVVLAGLDMDYTGKPFGPMPNLLAVAEYVTKVHAICVSCGNLAQFSNRTVSETSQVLVGAVEKYRPLCRACFTNTAS